MIKRSIIAVALCLWMGNAKAQLSGTIPGIADSVWTIQGNDLPYCHYYGQIWEFQY